MSKWPPSSGVPRGNAHAGRGSRAGERTPSAARVRAELDDRNWLGALRSVAPIARKGSLTLSERRLVLLVARRLFAEAEKAYRRGDRHLALQLLRALHRLPGAFPQGAEALETKLRVWLRSQRKGRSSVSTRKTPRPPAPRARVPEGPAERVKAAPDIEDEEGGKATGHGLRGGGMVTRRPRSAAGRSAPGVSLRRAEGVSARRRGGSTGRARKASPREASAARRRERKGEIVIHRTPHMELGAPEPLRTGTVFDLDVWADESGARPGERSESLAISVPASLEELTLSVTLLVSAHFEVQGDSHRKLAVRRDTPESSHATFTVAVRGTDLPRSQPELTAIFSYKGRPAGKVVRQPSIAGLKPQPPAGHPLAFAPEMVVTPEVAPPPPVAEIHENASEADLTISILDTGEKDGRHYRMIVDAAGGEHWEGPWVLSKRSDELVKTAMDVFVQAEDSDTGATGRIAALTGAGIGMFEATPPEFQALFWRLVDTRKPQTILIVSEEPYIPWELMVPTRWRNGRREDRQPLGVEFAIGRWLHRQYIPPPQEMSFDLTYVVAPRYSTPRRLRFAEREAKLVAKAFPPSRRIDPASVTALDSSLAKADVTLLHFVCHGKSDAPQTIYMDNERDNLNCLQVKALKGFLHAFPRARTFVFLNACEVGRPAPALVGIGGLANEFLAIGAGGVIAPLWSVADDVAFAVATEFYLTLQQSPKTTFASILQTIRKKAYMGTAQDTWAAYCYYGDPKAALHA